MHRTPFVSLSHDGENDRKGQLVKLESTEMTLQQIHAMPIPELESAMSQWVRCTQADGAAVYVNLEAVAAIVRHDRKSLTMIRFVGSDLHLPVIEDREEFMPRAAMTLPSESSVAVAQ
jgi:hypothetical protein